MPGSSAQTGRAQRGTDEQTPLLANSAVAPTADQDTEPEITQQPVTGDEKPLPRTQILLLCYARVVEPIAFFGIFPFINQMVQQNGKLQEADVGFYSGLIESIFSLTQMFVMIFWGRLADRIGRKPVLVISLSGVGVTTALFGFGRTIWQMMLFRCLAGVFAGSIVTVRTMISELSTKKTQARAFSFFAFAGNLGIFLGPLIGGALANPAAQYGGVFSRIAFCRAYPYALPTIVTGLIGLSAAVMTALFVKETKVHKITVIKPSNTSDTASRRSSSSPLWAPSSSIKNKISTWDLIRHPGVQPVLYIYAHTFLLAFAYTAIVPLFWYTRPELGGFGFSPILISLFMGLTGLSQAIWLLVVFPPLHKRVGTGGVLKGCAMVYPVFFLICPLLNLLLRQHTHATALVFWVLGAPVLTLGVGVSMAFTAVQLALNDISPSVEALSILNALALTLISGIRAFSPWLFNSLFAIGVKKQILWGYLVWVILIILGLAYTLAVRWLPQKASGIGQEQEDH